MTSALAISLSLSLSLQLSVLKEESCRILCEMELSHKQVRAFSQRIDEDYTIHMSVSLSLFPLSLSINERMKSTKV